MFCLNLVEVFMDHFTVVTCGHTTKNHRFLKFVWHTTTYTEKFYMSLARSSASAMFGGQNNIPNFEYLIRRDVYSFTSTLRASNNMLINAIENC